MAKFCVPFLLFFAASPAAAQVMLSGHSGYTFTAGEMAAGWDGGLNAGAALDVAIAQRIVLQGAVGYHRPRLSSIARGFVDHASLAVYTGMLNVKLLLSDSDDGMLPYILAGGGVYRADRSGSDVPGDGGEESGIETTTAAALTAALGMHTPLSESVGFFADLGYVIALTSGDSNHRYQPIRVGLTIGGFR